MLIVSGFSITEYIDWDAGTVSFDSPGFIELLEFADRFPDESNPEDANNVNVPADEAFADSRQLLLFTIVDEFKPRAAELNLLGGDIVFKGFPAEDRKGNYIMPHNSFAVFESSKNKDAAWEFIRMLLSEQWQTDWNDTRLPTNRAAFMQYMQTQLEQDYSDSRHHDDDISIKTPSPEEVQTYANKVLTLVESYTGGTSQRYDIPLIYIIMESSSDYFSGIVTAEHTSKVIQSRAAIYVSERSG